MCVNNGRGEFVNFAQLSRYRNELSKLKALDAASPANVYSQYLCTDVDRRWLAAAHNNGLPDNNRFEGIGT